MKTHFPRLASLAFAVLFTFTASAADTVTETFQKGLFEEEVANNLEAAIKAYSTVLEKLDEQRRLAATAAFRLGESYRRLGKTNEAVAHYQRVVRHFSDQTRLAELSQKALVDLGQSVPLQPAMSSLQQKLAARGQLPQAGPIDEEIKEIERLQIILRNSPDLINSRVGGQAPLHVAAIKGQLEVVRFLLDNQADIDVRDSSGSTPLHSAARSGHKSIAELLIARGANVNAATTDGQTPLHAAASNGFQALAEMLLAKGADVNATTRDKGTPLHQAVAARHKGTAALLIQHKADINRQDISGFSPLHHAALSQFPDTVKLLIANKAEVNVTNQSGVTPLNLAVGRWDEPVTKILLDHGANPNVPGNHARVRFPTDGNETQVKGTPLHHAVTAKNDTWIDLLLQFKADVNAKDERGATPLWMAVLQRDHERVQKLLEKGADPNIPDSSGALPLFLVCCGSQTSNPWAHVNLPIAESLIASGADVNAKRPTDNATALHFATRTGAIQGVKLLLSKGADPNAKGPKGYTPLHVTNWPENAALLIEKGADVNAADDEGNTPLHHAASRAYKPMVQELLDRGAKRDVMNKSEQTPLALSSMIYNRHDEWGVPDTSSRQSGLPVIDPVRLEIQALLGKPAPDKPAPPKN